MAERPAVRIANCSGFYGDRLSAATEMVDGGPIDFLTGDWLAELTMLILAKNRLRDPGAGYARTFVTQMDQVMATCLERGIKVVSNAGGMAPRACADAVATVADHLGLHPTIAVVEGDDLVPRLDDLRAAGVDFTHLDTGKPLPALADRSHPAAIAQYEVYLEAARNPALRDTVSKALAAFEHVAEISLAALGARTPATAAPGLVALIDGFMLHRVTRPDDHDPAGLVIAMRALLASQLIDETAADALFVCFDRAVPARTQAVAG